MNKILTKAQLIASLKDLADDDQILMRVDGGEYWGYYLETPEVKVLNVEYGMVDGNFKGHPKSRTPLLEHGTKVALIEY